MKKIAALVGAPLVLGFATVANAGGIELVCVDPGNGIAVNIMVDEHNRTATAGPAQPSHAYVDGNSIMFATETDGRKFYVSIDRGTGEMTVYDPEGKIDSVLQCSGARP
jgi:hypothetical protein